jgi:DNA-binding NarL/FixJ family response regulator
VKAGASGYLVKSASAAELVDAVHRTAAGDPVSTAGLAGLVLGEYRRMADASIGDTAGAEPPRLTERETDVLRLVAKGLTARQIAERLVLSHRTVEDHVQSTTRAGRPRKLRSTWWNASARRRSALDVGASACSTSGGAPTIASSST